MFIKEVTNLNDGVIYFNGNKIFEGDIATKECFDTIYKAATYDNPDIYDSIYKYVEEYAPDIIWEYRKKSNDVYMEYHDDIIDIFHELLANDFVNNEYDEESGFNSFGDNVDGLEWFIKDEEVTESLTIKEQSANIEVENPGILEVPEGKNVEDLPIKHFVALADKKGLSTITRALNNLQVWNKNKNPKLSKWAGDMIDKVTKRFENQKKESVNRLHIKEEYTGGTYEDDYTYRLEKELSRIKYVEELRHKLEIKGFTETDSMDYNIYDNYYGDDMSFDTWEKKESDSNVVVEFYYDEKYRIVEVRVWKSYDGVNTFLPDNYKESFKLNRKKNRR